jgi:hypothetical protein
MSPKSIKAHNNAAEAMCNQYIRNLRNVDLKDHKQVHSFTKLSTFAYTFKYEFAQIVRTTDGRISVRNEEIFHRAMWLIERELKNNPELNEKLMLIRAAQNLKADVDALAEHKANVSGGAIFAKVFD